MKQKETQNGQVVHSKRRSEVTDTCNLFEFITLFHFFCTLITSSFTVT